MKRILSIFSLLLTVILVSPRLYASTNVGATLSSDTQWDQSGSPYIIQARVLVPPGVTLKIGHGVQVVFQGPATLQISGDLKVEGSAAAPAVFNMTDGGLQSALFIDGGEAWLSNMKVLGGVFLAQDATIRMDGSEVTKGSGLYLKGSTVAHLKNNKFYGNATGVVLDGPIEADMQFNTLVQNTYGLYLKDFAKLTFTNNSVHDNDSEVVNNTSKAPLGGNYWGTLSPKSVKDKIKGTVSLSPMKDLKDILRAYLRSELPVITKRMSDQAEAEDIREDKAAREALKAYRAKQSQADVMAIEAKNQTMTPITTPTVAPVSPTATFTAVPPPAMAPIDLSVSTTVPTTSVIEPASMTPTLVASEPTVTPTSSPMPEPPAITNGLPAPPNLPSSVPEPPALSDLAGSTPVVNSNASTVSSSPTPGDLGGGAVSTNDLASIVATAQAVSTATTPVLSPTVVPDNSSSANVMPAPPAVDSTSSNMGAPPMPPSDLGSPGSPDTSAASAVTAVPTVVVSTPTPLPVTSVPTVSFVATVAAPAASSASPAIPKDAVPPPPDFGDSTLAGIQPPIVAVPNANAAPPVASSGNTVLPATSGASSAPATSITPTSDLDVDGMQAPPMDSGLDFSSPKK